MSNPSHIPETELSKNTIMNKPTPKPHRFHVPVYLIAVMLVLLGVSQFASWQMSRGLVDDNVGTSGGTLTPTSSPRPVIPPPDYSAEIRRYNDAVEKALERHLHRIDEMTGEFLDGLRQKGPSRFQPARAAIPGIKKSFASFDTMVGVVKDGAMDKVRGGDRLQRRFNAALDASFIRPCARAGEGLIADYETFAAKLAAEDAAFREELSAAHGKLPEVVRVEFPAGVLHERMAQTYRSLRGMPLKAGLVAAETAIELATIRTTVAAARSLALRFGAKAIGKSAVSIGAPVVDGPLPIGDVVAVGCAAWTAYDIRKLTKVLPQEIGKSLTSTVNTLQRDTIAAVEDATRKTRDAHKDAARKLAAEAKAN